MHGKLGYEYSNACVSRLKNVTSASVMRTDKGVLLSVGNGQLSEVQKPDRHVSTDRRNNKTVPSPAAKGFLIRSIGSQYGRLGGYQ